MLAQGTAFATTSHKEGKGKRGSNENTKFISDADWKAMSPEAQTKIINARKKAASEEEEDEDDKSSASSKSAKTMKSIPKTMKSLEKDNRRLNALQKCEEDDDNDLSISSAEGSSHFQKGDSQRFIFQDCSCSEIEQGIRFRFEKHSLVGQSIDI
jgi:hypothetical protein